MIKVIQNNTIIFKCTQGVKYVGSCRIFGLQPSIDNEKKQSHGNDLALGDRVGATVGEASVFEIESPLSR